MNPNFYVHFAKDTTKKKRSIAYINSTSPKIAGSTLRANEKKAIARDQSKIKRQVGRYDFRNMAPLHSILPITLSQLFTTTPQRNSSG